MPELTLTQLARHLLGMDEALRPLAPLRTPLPGLVRRFALAPRATGLGHRKRSVTA